MAKTISDLLDVSSSVLFDFGAFDPVLDLDTRLFIDPHLLKHCDIPELMASYEKFTANFKNIMKLLDASEKVGDVFWNKADRLLTGNEVKGLCIGYASKGTSGSGIGPALRSRLLETAKKIISKGKNDPEIFELVGMFEEDFGPDRISDMTANIIREDIVEFTKRVLSEIKLGDKASIVFSEKTGLPINPFTGDIILLVPYSILRDLPVALDWSNMDVVAKQNQELREKVNGIIGNSWREAMKTVSKEKLRNLILEYPELVDDLVRQYARKAASPYDFSEDRAGEFIWYPVTKELVKANPIKLAVSDRPTIEEVEKLVVTICEKFKDLIEYNGLNQLLYNNDGSTKNESAAQLLFYGVAESYCTSNNIMIARECNSGRGPVDFKFGTNNENGVLVELKKSTNTSGLKKGIEKQLPEYMKSEKSRRAIYLVIDVGYTQAAIENLKSINKKINGTNVQIMHVDGSQKVSASKM
ncbi:hypothetical protein [Rheinheimera pacifica]|uniref:hypothetical protein n=1 Tax=Rheinheimera pacifica TaxID=173990 RepID=UPI002ED84CA5